MNVHVDTNTMQIMDPTGHTTVNWDPNNTEEVATAKLTFEQLTGNGYYAFRLSNHGGRGERITTFDPQAKQMILAPQLVGG